MLYLYLRLRLIVKSLDATCQHLTYVKALEEQYYFRFVKSKINVILRKLVSIYTQNLQHNAPHHRAWCVNFQSTGYILGKN